MKPLLKWAGGKHKLAPRIARAFPWPCKGTYYEPFVGSASVFLHLRAEGLVERAVLADVNGRLIDMYRAVQQEPQAVVDALATMPEIQGPTWPEPYYQVREDFNAGGEGALQAARLLWINRTCFNGLYRVNQSGRFNVPVGKNHTMLPPRVERIFEVCRALRGVDLVHAPFSEVLPEAGPGDFVYCDPPYVPDRASQGFTSYARADFGLEDQHELAACAQAAGERGAVVVLSNHDLPIVRDELYTSDRGFEIVERFGVRRSIGRDVATRGHAQELLARIGRRVPARRRK